MIFPLQPPFVVDLPMIFPVFHGSQGRSQALTPGAWLGWEAWIAASTASWSWDRLKGICTFYRFSLYIYIIDQIYIYITIDAVYYIYNVYWLYILTSSFWNPWHVANIQAISETQGSRKGHRQIWEGPIAYHTVAQKICMVNLVGIAWRICIMHRSDITFQESIAIREGSDP